MTAEWSSQLSEARPRVVAALLRVFRDLEVAEDAYQEACLRALRSWERSGPPKDPTAWLVLVGRNVALDGLRRSQRRQELALAEVAGATHIEAELETEASLVEGLERRSFGDDVLRLFFVCCDPVLQPQEQIALALKVVAGLGVPEIASAFLLKPKTLEQRLTRAKRRLASADINYRSPSKAEREGRLPVVTSMIYLIFNEGYAASGGEAHLRGALCDEAIRLSRCLLRVAPSEVEVMGLLALCLLQHARVEARLDGLGEIIPLAEQDRSLWRRELIAEGQVLLEKALRRRRPGPLQIQAAIAAVHGAAASAAETDWSEIERLYGALEALEPTPVVTLNRAVAVKYDKGPRAALELIEPLSDALAEYFYFHGLRGALLAELDEEDGARVAWERALELAGTAAEKAHIEKRLAGLDGSRERKKK